jgi:Cytochrome P450
MWIWPLVACFLSSVSLVGALRMSASQGAVRTGTGGGETKLQVGYNLPPGKPKWPIFGDTLQLINAKTMGSYQLASREKFGEIWRTSLFFTPAVFVTGEDNLKEIFTEEARKMTSVRQMMLRGRCLHMRVPLWASGFNQSAVDSPPPRPHSYSSYALTDLTYNTSCYCKGVFPPSPQEAIWRKLVTSSKRHLPR